MYLSEVITWVTSVSFRRIIYHSKLATSQTKPNLRHSDLWLSQKFPSCFLVLSYFHIFSCYFEDFYPFF